jgi:Glycoside hydrolase 123, catalytic domain
MTGGRRWFLERGVFFLLLAVGTCGTRPSAVAQDHPVKLKIWAVSDNVRVSPVTGKVLVEGKNRIHADYPRDSFQQRNLVWDSAAKKVTLHSARNEFTAFQLILQPDGPVGGVDVDLASLKNESGQTIQKPFIAIFREWYVKVTRPSYGYEASSLGPDWYPDALMPKRSSRLYPGLPLDLPDDYNKIENQKNQAIWFDLYVPFERTAAPPGKYGGDVVVSWTGGTDRIQVELNVWDFALPQENHLPGDIWNGSMRNMPMRQEMAYYQLAQQHRFLPLIYAYRPGLSIQGGKATLDWGEYDKRLSPYMDGSAFTEKYGYWGPGHGVPIHHVMLPFDVEKHGSKSSAWPMALPDAGRTPEYEAIWKDVGRQFREHMDRYPAWRKVLKIAFLNGLDESYDEDSYEKMIYYGKLLHEALGRGWFKYRIDGGYSREAMEKLCAEIDLWVCHTVSFDIEIVDYFRKKGVDTWLYGPMIYEQRKNSGIGSNTLLDLDLNVNRAIGWVGWKYQAGWVQWEFDWNAFAAWYEAENYKLPKMPYNGSGQLIYRGEVMGYDKPIPSIRLKSTRRGLQDFEYFWLLAQAPGGRPAADQFCNRVIYKRPFGEASILDTEIWKNDPDEWERVRIEAGEELARRSR